MTAPELTLFCLVSFLFLCVGVVGGWGIKFGLFGNKARGNAVNISGDIGIQLELKNGKKLLIGTQKEAESKSVIQNYQNNIQ